MSSEPEPASACLSYSVLPYEHLHILLESLFLEQHTIHSQVRQGGTSKTSANKVQLLCWA